jgi:uncharacterized protein
MLQSISHKTWLSLPVINTIITLLDEGNTIPFIARYRKEMTGGATDEQLRDFYDIYSYTKNLEARKEAVINLIAEKWLMTPELEKEIRDAQTLARVEDLYRPYKEKKNTKASLAKAKGLDLLAEILKKCDLTKEAFELEAAKFINDTGDAKTSVNTIAEAIQGAKDILAEEVSDDAKLRDELRTHADKSVLLTTKTTKTFDPNGTYKIYGNYSKKRADIPGYAYLALVRAEEEKQLKLDVQRGEETLTRVSESRFVPKNPQSVVSYLKEAIDDGLHRLLLPSLERELHADKKRRADEAAIKVFGDNMRHLLLTPPLRDKVVMWFDPAYRTGCKIAIMDATGKFLYNTVIYPTPPQSDIAGATLKLLEMIEQYRVDVIVIGNWTASRESEQFVSQALQQLEAKNKLLTPNSQFSTPKYMVVSEAGASVYSASPLAQEEYPDLDVTVRGAISIGHRAQDALAELTKIDPKAIGVGQYQHDVDQKLLAQKLDEKVQDTVNSVGVDVNTASYTLLQYIAGLTPAIAKNIVIYRDENWPFTSKSQLKKVKGLWPKAYEQCVWFLRIQWGKEPLDQTGIHPEMYDVTYQLLSELGIDKKKLQLPVSESFFAGWNEQKIANKSQEMWIGYDTFADIIKELQRPWLDPRDEIEAPVFKSNVLDIKDVTKGMMLDGVVRNVVDFGAFIDVGLHNDGFIHKSQIGNFFVTNPADHLHVGQQIKAKVIDIDYDKEKISLSMKTDDGAPTPRSQAPKPVIKKPEPEVEPTFTSNINWG